MAALTLFLILLLCVSAGHKCVQRDRLALVAARLAGMSARTGPILLVIAATAEVLAALALLLPVTRVGGAIAAAVIWSAYALALFRHRGSVLDCGCHLVRREKPIGMFVILRPPCLAVLALTSAVVPATDWPLDTPFAAAALLALWFTASELAANPIVKRSAKRTK
jgi:hypothetical protein